MTRRAGTFPQAYDGASPGSLLLSSAGTLFTPGLAQQDGNGQRFYQTDALGSVRGFTNNAQSPQGEVYYDAASCGRGRCPFPLLEAMTWAHAIGSDADRLLAKRKLEVAALKPVKFKRNQDWKRLQKRRRLLFVLR